MKRHGNLYEKIISIENLRKAAATAAKANGRTRAVDDFYSDEEGNLQRLHQSLADFSFRPSRPSTFTVHEPKERTITTAPFYPDKIVEQAIVQVIEPILYPVFIYTSYGSIKKKGCLRLSQDARNALDTDRRNCLYCLQTDIHHAFPSVDHDILLQLLSRKIKCAPTLWLIRILLNTPGLKIGGRMSQLLFNFFLSYFDHWMKEVKHVRHYFRYMDDMIVLHSSKSYLRQLLAEMEDYLRDRLHLPLKPSKQIYPIARDRHDRHGRPIDIAGYVLYLNQTRLRKRIKQRLCRKLAVLRRCHIGRTAFLQAVAPWWGWLLSTDSSFLLNKLQTLSPYEIQFKNTSRAAA